MGSEGAEGYGGGTVEAAYCPPVDRHYEVYDLPDGLLEWREDIVLVHLLVVHLWNPELLVGIRQPEIPNIEP